MAVNWKREYTRYRSFFMDIYRVYRERRDVRMFLEIVLSLLTVSFFTAAALRPTALTITQLLADIKTKEDTVTRLNTKIASLEAAKTAYQEELPRLEFLDQAIPELPSPEGFMRQAEGVAGRNGVVINSLVMNDVVLIGPTQDALDFNLARFPDGSGEVKFSINILGNYNNLTNFLSDLENLRRPIKIDTSSINITEGDQSSELTLTATGRFPYFKNSND